MARLARRGSGDDEHVPAALAATSRARRTLRRRRRTLLRTTAVPSRRPVEMPERGSGQVHSAGSAASRADERGCGAALCIAGSRPPSGASRAARPCHRAGRVRRSASCGPLRAARRARAGRPCVFMRARKPCSLARCRFLGWYVCLVMLGPSGAPPGSRSGGRVTTGLAPSGMINAPGTLPQRGGPHAGASKARTSRRDDSRRRRCGLSDRASASARCRIDRPGGGRPRRRAPATIRRDAGGGPVR